MARGYGSEVLAAVHETALDMADAGAVSKRTMREFDEMCLTPVAELLPEEIRALRLRENASQAVFARYLNVTAGLVSQCERGEKRPRRASLKSTTAEFCFEILDRSADEPIPASTDRVSAPPQPTRIAPKRRSTPDMGDGRRLFLVSCVKTKLPTRAPAKELYVSAWFCKARDCVESTGCPWGILSAEYGLVHPDEEIRPYEKTLNAMPVVERRAWANEVLESMDPFLAGIDTVVFFAGARYREFLEPGLREWGLAVSVPMLGLSQGRQLAWLNDCLHG